MKKSATPQPRKKSATPQPKPREAPQSRMSPPSPLINRREEERGHLSHLNNRLAHYIDRVRLLENEKNILQEEIKVCKTQFTSDTSKIKDLYETELKEARKMIDSLSNTQAELQMENTKFRAERDDLVKRADENHSEVQRLSANLADAQRHISRMRDAEKSLESLKDQLAQSQKSLESETLQRIRLQNELHTCKEELKFRTELAERQAAEWTSTSYDSRVLEITRDCESELQSRLQDQLEMLRAEHAQALAKVKQDHDSSYRSRLEKMTTRAEAADSAARSQRERCDALSSQLSSANSRLNSLGSRVTELESTLTQSKADFDNERAALRAQIEKLNSLVAEQQQEYQDLVDIKVSLDLELRAYEQLLESEESRLKYAPSESPKRKRQLFSSSVADYSGTSYEQTCHAEGPLCIDDSQPDGHFVRIRNNSTDAANLAGLVLVRTVDGDIEHQYKFPRSATLPAGESVTIFSHEAPGAPKQSDVAKHMYVMKNQHWPARAGALTVTKLQDNTKDLAICTEKRVVGNRPISHAQRMGSKTECCLM